MIDEKIVIDKLNNIKANFKEYFEKHPRRYITAKNMDHFLDLLAEFIENIVEEILDE
jgi:hypothetical protein